MSFFKDVKNLIKHGGDVVTFSKVEGRVTFKGEPVINAKITRRVVDSDERNHDDFATTDNHGIFTMPTLYGKSDGPMQEVYAWQYIFIEFNNEQKEIWFYTKHEKEEHSELNGIPIRLVCELTNSERILEDELGRRIITTCDLIGFSGTNVANNH